MIAARRTLPAALAGLAGLGAVLCGFACGGSQREQVAREAQPFQCRNRVASYVVAHHLAGDELGVQIDCAQAGPRIKRWRSDKLGNRQEDAHSLTPGEFDSVWKEIDGTGWPNLHDCTNGTAGKQDPIYTFDVKDDQNQASFQCQSQSMPYPYNDIVDPLDLAAQKGRRQLGDDEPVEMKQRDAGTPAKARRK
ncbi:MAG TPA: hypothetical protein VFT22_40575 [Kofleriaceae bacterium]|nr:hypothetical protein [Kofleriaceae bacterium]